MDALSLGPDQQNLLDLMWLSDEQKESLLLILRFTRALAYWDAHYTGPPEALLHPSGGRTPRYGTGLFVSPSTLLEFRGRAWFTWELRMWPWASAKYATRILQVHFGGPGSPLGTIPAEPYGTWLAFGNDEPGLPCHRPEQVKSFLERLWRSPALTGVIPKLNDRDGWLRLSLADYPFPLLVRPAILAAFSGRQDHRGPYPMLFSEGKAHPGRRLEQTTQLQVKLAEHARTGALLENKPTSHFPWRVSLSVREMPWEKVKALPHFVESVPEGAPTFSENGFGSSSSYAPTNFVLYVESALDAVGAPITALNGMGLSMRLGAGEEPELRYAHTNFDGDATEWLFQLYYGPGWGQEEV